MPIKTIKIDETYQTLGGGVGGDGVRDVEVDGTSVVRPDRVAEIWLPDTYTKEEIKELLTQVNTAEFAGPYPTADEIPTPYDTNDLYLVGTAPYQIYVYIASRGELVNIGGTSVDLSDFRKAVDQDIIDAKKQPLLIAGPGITITGETISSSVSIVPVQTVGTSTSDIMSQKATTDMVFLPKATQQDYDRISMGVVSTAVADIPNIININAGGVTDNTAPGYNSILISAIAFAGNPPKAGNFCVSINGRAEGNTSNSILIGSGSSIAKAQNGSNGTVGIGAGATASGAGSVSIGNGTAAIGTGIAVGANAYTSSDHSIVIGGNARNAGAGGYKIAIGRDSQTDAQRSVALGASAKSLTRDDEVSVGDPSLAVTANYGTRFVANVRDPELPQDAATKAYVDAQGGGGVTPVQTTGDSTTDVMSQKATTDMIYLPKSTGQDYDRISIGKDSSAVVDVPNIININAGAAPSPNAQAINSVLISSSLRDSTQSGNIPRVIGAYGVAINGRVDAESGIAIGSGISVARANGINSVAIGLAALAATTLSTAVGANSSVSSTSLNGTAIGGGATTTVDAGTAVGAHANVSGINGVAIGRGAKSMSVRSVAIGAYAETSRDDELSIGNSSRTRFVANVTNPTAAQDAATKNYVDVGNSYSLTETATGGTWINGKPIYRRVVVCNGLPNSAIKTFAHNIANVDEIISVSGNMFITATGAPGGILNFVRAESIPNSIGANADRVNISIAAGMDRTAISANVILEYTKL